MITYLRTYNCECIREILYNNSNLFLQIYRTGIIYKGKVIQNFILYKISKNY